MKNLSNVLLLTLVAFIVVSCGKKEAYKSVDSFKANVTVLKTNKAEEKDAYVKSLAALKDDHQKNLVESQSVKSEIAGIVETEEENKTSELEERQVELEEKQTELTESISKFDASAKELISENIKKMFQAQVMISQATVNDTNYRVEVKLSDEDRVIMASDVKYDAETLALSFRYSIKAEDQGFLHYDFSTEDGKTGDITVIKSDAEEALVNTEVKHLGMVEFNKETEAVLTPFFKLENDGSVTILK